MKRLEPIYIQSQLITTNLDHHLHYKIYGSYTQISFEFVKLDDVEPRDPWNNERLENNMRLIKETKSTVPIELCWDDENGKYAINDGIHRTHCARELGYTHIPAIVEHGFSTPPDQPIDQLELLHRGILTDIQDFTATLNNISRRKDREDMLISYDVDTKERRMCYQSPIPGIDDIIEYRLGDDVLLISIPDSIYKELGINDDLIDSRKEHRFIKEWKCNRVQ